MSLSAKNVEQILKLLEDSSFDSLDLTVDGVRIQLRRKGAGPGAASAHAAHAAHAPAVAAAPVAAADAGEATVIQAPMGARSVTAPLLGIFYRAPKPGEPPFVEVGSRVTPETIVGIIEVMKLMNTVRAGVSGEVAAIAARNGDLVEYGETLLFVREG